MTNNFISQLRAFFRDSMPALSVAERRKSSLGALLGIGLCGVLLRIMPVNAHWLIAPMGASAVLLFAVPHSPLAQPWSLVGSFLLATVAGLASAYAIPSVPLAAAVAVAASIWLMARFNCVHPPGGAVALFVVLDGPYTAARLAPTFLMVALNAMAMLAAAVLINNLVLGRRYPFPPKTSEVHPHQTDDDPPLKRIGLSHADLDSALRALDTFVDVQETELVQIYNLAVDHAFGRHIGMTCGDIMSRDVVSVGLDTDLEEAWKLLSTHHIKALPVVDKFKQLAGILTIADYLPRFDNTPPAGLAVRLRGLLGGAPGPASKKSQVVRQLMTTEVQTARVDTSIAELVHQLSDKSLHHIPIIDETRRVLGIVSQSDIIVALYKRVALSTV